MVQGVKRLLEACHITEMLQGGAELDALDKLVDKGRAVRDMVKGPGQVGHFSLTLVLLCTCLTCCTKQGLRLTPWTRPWVALQLFA